MCMFIIIERSVDTPTGKCIWCFKAKIRQNHHLTWALVQSDYSSLTLRELAPIGSCNNSSIVSPFSKIAFSDSRNFFCGKMRLEKIMN